MHDAFKLYLKKIENDESLLKNLQKKNSDGKYNEWIVTVAFYRVVHHICAYLEHTGQPLPKNHHDRHQLVRNDKFLKVVYSQYRNLHRQSQNVRYEAIRTPLSNDDVQHILDNYYSPIVKHISPLIT